MEQVASVTHCKIERIVKHQEWRGANTALFQTPEGYYQAIEHGSGYEVQSGPLVVKVSHHDTSAVPYVTLQLVPIFSTAVYVDSRKLITKKMIGVSGLKTKPVE